MATAERTYQNYINGQWLEAANSERRPNENPADTREVLGEFPRSTQDDTRKAIDAAAAALPEWRRVSGPQRSGILHKAANLLEQRAQEVGEALTREEGKTIAEGVGEAMRGVAILRYYAGEPLRPFGEHYQATNPDTFLYTERVPLGVVGVITPWNFPAAIPVWKLAPCLAYGNTALFKPAELTPLTAHLIVEILDEAGLPPGVLNLVQGPGSIVGEELATNRKVNGISFTGSAEVGRHLYRTATDRGAKVQLELGGKNPLIIAEDADIDQAVDLAISGAMRSTGQKCTATSRAIAVGDVADRFTDALVERANSIRVGPGIDKESFMGPLVSEDQRKRVLEYIDIGQKEGAKLLAGGKQLSGTNYDNGYYIAPTVFDNVDPAMRIAREEIFGPVVGVIRAKSMQEAIDIANNVDYGLSASIATRDIGRAFEFIRSIDAGIVHVNSETAGAEPHVPFGGMKESSSFSREQGRAAMEFYTQTKTVYLDMPAS